MDNTTEVDQVEGRFDQLLTTSSIVARDGIITDADPLALDIDDDELVKIVDKRIKDSKRFFKEKYNLYDRRKKNEDFLFGRQVSRKEEKHQLKAYESRNNDNALFEIEASIKPLAMSRLPDMIIIPGKNTPESIQTAEDISKAVDSEIKKRNTRKVLGVAFKHLPVYFTGIIKARWNPEAGNGGDYVFEVVHPDNVVFDETCPTNNADDMNFVAQALPLTVQEVVMRFPDKKEELFQALRDDGLLVGVGDPTWKDLASEIKIWEVWADWYKRSDPSTQPAPNPDDPALPTQEYKWEKIPGVIWKYKKVILKKMKNPNYDFEGTPEVFTYDDPLDTESKRKLNPQEMMLSAMTGEMPANSEQETIYRNYFDMPRKPYFFLGYDQWGKVAIDETTRIEQNIANQEVLDKRTKQINETLDNRGKHIFSKDGGLKPDDLEKMDLDDPKQDILVEGDVNKTHAFIPPERPTAQEFDDINMTRERMYAISGSSAVRGQIQSDTATTNQIAREADFTRADDLVEDTINAASEWMASWALQFIKLRYTEDHMRRLLGSKGKVIFIKLHRDMIEDGMEVMIKSSGTDKLKAQRNAMEMAQLGAPFTNPLDFFRDMGIDDPEGRTERGLTFATDPTTYLVKYVMGMQNTPQMVDGMLGQGSAAALSGQPVAPGAQNPAPAPINQQPGAPTPTDTTQVPTAPPAVPQGSPRAL